MGGGSLSYASGGSLSFITHKLKPHVAFEARHRGENDCLATINHGAANIAGIHLQTLSRDR
jgi:hypothetical protein